METHTGSTQSEQFDNVPWQWLKEHHERGSLILVDTALELCMVEERLAADDTSVVQNWLASRLIAKPTAAQVMLWDQEPSRPFSMMVVKPFVLIQESSSEQSGTTQ